MRLSIGDAPCWRKAGRIIANGVSAGLWTAFKSLLASLNCDGGYGLTLLCLGMPAVAVA